MRPCLLPPPRGLRRPAASIDDECEELCEYFGQLNDPVLSTSTVRDSHVLVDVYFETLRIRELTEGVTLTFDGLLGQMGGNLGLLSLIHI